MVNLKVSVSIKKLNDLSKAQFLLPRTSDILDWIILCCWGAVLCIVEYSAVSLVFY